MASQIPLKRLRLASEIASATVFLASDDSTFMLGAEVVVGGGVISMCQLPFKEGQYNPEPKS